MKVRLLVPANAAGMIDPVTKRTPFLDPETKAVVIEADVPEDNFWVRRILAGEIERVDQPNGNAPIAPLTTRAGR